MTYLIDTNICIYLIKQRPASVLARLKQFKLQDIKISAISVAELQFGISKSQRILHNQTVLNEFLVPFEVLPFSQRHTISYGNIRAQLQKSGCLIGPMDLLIAAHALAENLTLVTNNIKEFERVPGLQVENWLAA